MDEEMIFCVQNPETGEMGYCLVFGKAGEFHVFNVYQGSQGLLGLMNLKKLCMNTKATAPNTYKYIKPILGAMCKPAKCLYGIELRQKESELEKTQLKLAKQNAFLENYLTQYAIVTYNNHRKGTK